MTRQTPQPFVHHAHNPTHRPAVGLVSEVKEGSLLLDPPYQRGDVWTLRQRMALVESWLRGWPTHVVTLAMRGTDLWRAANNGHDPYDTGKGITAVIDGKQRITTAKMWFSSEFAVPASWMQSRFIEATEDTDDGPYVRYDGLSVVGRRFMENYCMLLVAETKDCATVQEEAAFYLLLNGGGMMQSEADMANAARVAGR